MSTEAQAWAKIDELREELKRAVAAEREACAALAVAVAEECAWSYGTIPECRATGNQIADAIRARQDGAGSTIGVKKVCR